MWPWEHVAFGYLLYSLAVRGVTDEPPQRADAHAVVFAALLPDLVDKPLSWTFSLFPSGYSVAHSAFVATAVLALVLSVAQVDGRERTAVAFAVGYGSHLVGDVVYPAVLGDGLAPSVVLWPLVSQPAYTVQYGLIERGLLYLSRHLHLLSEPAAQWLLGAELLFLATVATLWLADGTPGIPPLSRAQEPEQPPE